MPKAEKEVRSFIGLCSYYRSFVLKFASVAKPLHQLTEKGRKFVWTDDSQIAFETLKHRLTTTPIMGYPKNDSLFILDTDASNVGAVLSQNQNGVERVISYYSKTFSKCERNYCVTRKELLAIVNAIKNFHHYLYGRPFVVRTDHGSLRWLINFKNPEGQLARWLETLSAYDYIIMHRPGHTHSNADALSRRPCLENCSHCSKSEVKDKVYVVGIAELKDESSVNVEVISHTFVPVEPLSRPDKGFCSVINDGETGLGIEEYKGKIKLDKTSSEVCTEALSLESCAHKTCSNTTDIDEGDSCTDEINTGMICKKVSVYSTSNAHCKGEFARETSPEVCKFETVSRSSKDTNRCAYHSVGAVKTLSNTNEARIRERPKAEFSEISSDNDNDELVLEQRNDPTLSLIIKWKENYWKPSWAEVSKYSPVVKYYWNRLDSFEIKDGVLCRKWENNTAKNITWQVVIPKN